MEEIELHFNKESGKYKCNYCGHDFGTNTSRTRLRRHLIRVPSSGSKSCPNVPDDVRRTQSLIHDILKKETGYIRCRSNIPSEEQENLLRDDNMVINFLNDANNDFGNQRGVLQEPHESGSRNFRLINQVDRSGVTFELNSPVNAEGGDIAMDDRQELDDGNVMRHLRNDNEKSWVCQFCAHPFPWQVLPQTFGHHLATLCESAPEYVKEAAGRAECNDSNFNTYTQTYGSSNAEVEAAECSISVNWKPMIILDPSGDNDRCFVAETEGSNDECQKLQGMEEEEASSVQGTRREGIAVQKSNERRRSTSPVVVVAALELPMVQGIQDSGDSASSLTKRPRRI